MIKQKKKNVKYELCEEAKKKYHKYSHILNHVVYDNSITLLQILGAGALFNLSVFLTLNGHIASFANSLKSSVDVTAFAIPFVLCTAILCGFFTYFFIRHHTNVWIRACLAVFASLFVLTLGNLIQEGLDLGFPPTSWLNVAFPFIFLALLALLFLCFALLLKHLARKKIIAIQDDHMRRHCPELFINLKPKKHMKQLQALVDELEEDILEDDEIETLFTLPLIRRNELIHAIHDQLISTRGDKEDEDNEEDT